MIKLPCVIFAINENTNAADLGIPAVCCATFSRVSGIGSSMEVIPLSDEYRSILLLPNITPRIFAVRVPEPGRHHSRQALAKPGLAVKDASFLRYFKAW
jgi:hypothetical protein